MRAAMSDTVRMILDTGTHEERWALAHFLYDLPHGPAQPFAFRGKTYYFRRSSVREKEGE